VKRQGPRFLDDPESSAVEPVAERVQEPARADVERPRLHDALPNAPTAIGEDWQPGRVPRAARRFGAGWVAAAGIALIIAGWLGTTMTLAALSSYQVSPLMGDVVLATYAVGGLLVLVAIGAEWRAMRSVRQVELVRGALRASSTVPLPELRDVILRWLRTLPGRLEVDPMVLEAIQRAESADQIVAILRNRVAPPLEAETQRIGLRVATEGSLLVAISPHQSWDGVIVALYGLRIVRRVAVAYGLRPSGMVTLMLLRRTLRAALEIAAVQIVAQGAGAKLLESTPILRHLAGAIPGLSTSELRLYRLAVVAAEACNPLAD
jgi:putative membrane protein